jgi:hypothetical protein
MLDRQNLFKPAVGWRSHGGEGLVQRITNLQAVGFLSGYVGDPRTYGVSISYKFSR